MPTAKKPLELNGEYGLESNVGKHDANEMSFRVFRDLITDNARLIVKRDGKGASLGTLGAAVQVIHEFVYLDANGTEEYFVLGARDGGSYIYLWDGVTTWAGQTLPITPTAGGKWFFLNADNRVFACNGRDALLVGNRSGVGTLAWRTAGVDAPTFAPTYSLTATNPPVTNVTSGTTVAATQGSKTVTNSGVAFVTGAPSPWIGKRIVINGNAYTIEAVATTSSLTITETFRETTATGLSFSVFPGVGDWDVGPRYAFSYYNPTTGHASNPSPVVEITEQNQFGRTPVVTIAGSGENTTAFNNGYTQIQLFRTPKNSGILVALNEKLNNNNAGTSIAYTETASKFADTFLTDIERPLLNYKPPTGLASLAYHQGRGWGYHKPSGAIRVTPISVQVDLGKAIECWPPLYKIDIDAVPRGLVVVGGESSADSLIIQSSRGDFSVDGYDPITFSPYKVRTRQSGGNQFSATSVDGDLVQFYQDKRLFAMREDIGRAIQDKLSSVKDSLITSARLHWFSSKTRNFLLLSVPKDSSSTANDYTYVWDLDRDGGVPIYEWNFGSSAFATVHDASSNALKLLAGDSTGVVYQLLSGSNQDAGSNFAPTLRTALFRFTEERDRIHYVKLFVNDAQITSGDLTAWTGYIYINENTNTGATDGTAIPMTFRRHRTVKESAQGKELIFFPTMSKRTKAKVFQLDFTFPTANAALHIEKIIIGFSPETEAEAEA